MFKFLFVFLLLILLFSLIALRYRREITFLIKLLRLLSSSFGDKDSNEESLVFCATCKKWVASSRALSMGMGNFYCSRECVNRLSRHE